MFPYFETSNANGYNQDSWRLENQEGFMKVQILGTGCPKCKLLEQHAREAIAELGSDAVVEKVTAIDDIMEMGVMMTPALAIDGVVKSVGKVLAKDQVIAYIKGGN
jgi:small redox-active disulfide protein 2